MNETRRALLNVAPDVLLREELPESPLRDEPGGRVFGPWRLASDAIAWIELTEARLPLAGSGSWVFDPPKNIRRLVVLVADDPIEDLDAWREVSGVEGEAHCDSDYRWFTYEPDVGAALQRRLKSLMRTITKGKSGRPRGREINSAAVTMAASRLNARGEIKPPTCEQLADEIMGDDADSVADAKNVERAIREAWGSKDQFDTMWALWDGTVRWD